MSTPNASTTTPAAPAATAPTPAPAPVGPQAATIGELKARFPGESEFVLAQLEAKATIEQANAAFVSVKLERAEKKNADLEAKLAAAPKPSPAPSAQKPGGIDPVAGQSTTSSDTPLAKSGDFVARAREIAREKQITYTAAATELAKDEPELHAAYVDRQHDETKARQRRSGRK